MAAGAIVVAAWVAGIAAGAASAPALGAAKSVAAAQLLPSLSATVAGLSGLAWAWLAILAITAVFGRLYCAALCPLGTIQDAAAALGRRAGLPRILAARRAFGGAALRARRPDGFPLPGGRSRIASVGRLALAVAGVAGAAVAPAMLAWLEPYAIATRLAGSAAGLAWDGLGAAAASIRLNLPSAPFRPDPAWAAVAALPGVAVVVASIVSGRRSFCSSLCPSGAILELAASKAPFAVRIDAAACVSCGSCERVCGVGAADAAGKRICAGACVACFDCAPKCPTGAIRYGSAVPGRPVRASRPAPATCSAATGLALTRRDFIAAGAFGTAGLAIAALAAPAAALSLGKGTSAKVTLDGTPRLWASPPGSRSLARYARLCVSCGLCARSCPSGVLRQAAASWRIAAPLVPYMDYARGFCQFECVACGEACPTGAIDALGVDEKTIVAVAKSRLDLPKCIVVEKGTRCGACAEHCPTGAISMGAVPGAVLPGPILDPAFCVGCGACETVCPAEPTKALIVEGLSAHERASVLPTRPGAGAQSSGADRGPGVEGPPPQGSEGFAF